MCVALSWRSPQPLSREYWGRESNSKAPGRGEDSGPGDPVRLEEVRCWIPLSTGVGDGEAWATGQEVKFSGAKESVSGDEMAGLK